jgi:PatG C-terminal/Subtilase family/PatG Domain
VKATNIAALPGLQDLWGETWGDPRIRIAVLDGPVDRAHPCFAGADLSEAETPFAEAPGLGPMSRHGTHVASMIFGQPGGPIRGIAPASHGVLATVYSDRADRRTSQMDLARAINQVLNDGVHVINISGGELSNGGYADQMLANAVRSCQDQGVLIVAAAGNDACQCLHVPAALPSVLAVGAMDQGGVPLDMSNWGDVYKTQGILAPGQNMIGAMPGGGLALASGTSYAAPVVTGIVALLLSCQLNGGDTLDPLAVGEALLKSGLPCDEKLRNDCQRFLAGRLNIPGARDLLSTRRRIAMSDEKSAGNGHLTNTAVLPAGSIAESVTAQGALEAGAIEPSGEVSDSPQSLAGQPDASRQEPAPAAPPRTATGPARVFQAVRAPRSSGIVQAVRPSSVEASCGCKNGGSKHYVFAIGSLNFDFGTEARRDSFKQLMPNITPDGLPYIDKPQPRGNVDEDQPVEEQPYTYPPNPYDARQIVNYLCGYPPPHYPWPTQGGFPALRPYPRDAYSEESYPTDPHDPGEPPPEKPKTWPFDESVPSFPSPCPLPGEHHPNYLRGFPAHLSEASELIWTLNIEQTPIYAIRPEGAFSTEAYQRLVAFLAGQVREPNDWDYVSRVSIPGMLTNETVQLFSGQVVPVVVPYVRGMYAWDERQMIEKLYWQMYPKQSLPKDQQAREQQKTGFVAQMHDFLNRIYYELRNLGQTSPERALNYAATNAFQAAGVMIAVAEKASLYQNAGGIFALNTITATKSPFCRIDSDCWDVNLSFFYPQNIMIASDVFSFTVDVSDSYPVSIGPTRHWSVPTFGVNV